MLSLTDDRPSDFDSYWQSTLRDLAPLAPAPELEHLPVRDTDFAELYGVRLTSIGPYRLFAYLSIPKGAGPFPARYTAGNYGSVHSIPSGPANISRGRYITFSIAVRGQRGSDRPFAADFPGLLTAGIDDPEAYVYRGIVADCCRGLDYLLSRPEVDPSRVLATGNELALITAALRPQITHVVYTPGLFYATADLAPLTEAYPLEEINDYLRLYPEKRKAVHRSLSYMDTRWFAPKVKATTLLMVGGKGELFSRENLAPLARSLGGSIEVYETTHSGYTDGVFTEEWITRQSGFSDAILPEQWQLRRRQPCGYPRLPP